MERMEDIKLDIGIDGFQLSKSSKKVGWPIIGSVVGIELDPVIIGLWVGSTKQSLFDDFMSLFRVEMNDLVAGGGVRLRNGGPLVHVSVCAFIADKPTRSYYTHYFNHAAGCHNNDREGWEEPPLRFHLYNIGLTSVPDCRLCNIGLETSIHIMCECRALDKSRHDIYGKARLVVKDIRMSSLTEIRRLVRAADSLLG